MIWLAGLTLYAYSAARERNLIACNDYVEKIFEGLTQSPGLEEAKKVCNDSFGSFL